jgi:hypothetical protein
MSAALQTERLVDFAELAGILGVSRTTAHRILWHASHDHGVRYEHRDGKRLYALSEILAVVTAAGGAP